MLSDTQIRAALNLGQIVIEPPPQDGDIQPASVDVHLGRRFGRLKKQHSIYNLTASSDVEYFERDSITLKPGQFILGQLAESLTLNASHIARIEGKSSVGRKGIAIHVTAGFVDPGWSGVLTIELFNASNISYLLRAGDPIGQLAFDRLEVPSKRPYGHKELNSHYQNSEEVKGSYHDSGSEGDSRLNQSDGPSVDNDGSSDAPVRSSGVQHTPSV
jgi:dCTP deaminase